MPQAAKPAIEVLAVLPEAEDCQSLWQIFVHSHWILCVARSFAEAQAHFRNRRIGVIITAVELPNGRSWKDVLEAAQKSATAPHVIVTSRLPDERLWAEVLNLGGFDVILKPFAAEEVRHAVSSAWRFWHERPTPGGASAGNLAFTA